MSLPLVVLPNAEADFEHSARWYESERPGLGRYFVQAVRSVFDRIKHTPMQFPEIAKAVRRKMLPKFPYGIFFRIQNSQIAVIAILHLHRHPESWRSRN